MEVSTAGRFVGSPHTTARTEVTEHRHCPPGFGNGDSPQASPSLGRSRELRLGQSALARLGLLPRAQRGFTCSPLGGQRPAHTQRLPGLRLILASERPP